MSDKKIKIAICYDFDGTLAPGNMQEHSLLPDLQQKSSKFWTEVKDFAKKNSMNEILAYMYLILDKANRANHQIKKEAFKKHGKNILLFEGVENFFIEINNLAASMGITIEHFIISSGLKEIIEGTKIKKYFKFIFASEFYYDVNGVAKWPAVAIDYTAKTQYLFRINKGIFNIWDNSKINKFKPENKRYIPFHKIIYVGDGETDVPCMKLVNSKGGYSIAVYDPNKRKAKSICQELVNHDRAKFISKANFNKNEELFKLLEKIFRKIILEEELYKTSNNSKAFTKK